MALLLHPLLLLAVFCIPNRAFAVTYCSAPTHLIFRGFPEPPPLIDCYKISTHIPTLPNYFDYPNLDRDHSPNSPFFPQAMLHHGKCLVRVSYHAGLQPPAYRGPALDWLHQEPSYTPEAPLSEQSVFSMWATIRAGIDIITDECLVNDRVGVVWDFVDVPEIPGAWLAVEIMGTEPSQNWTDAPWTARDWMDQTREQQLIAMRGYQIDEERAEGGSKRFKLTFLDLP